MRKLALTLVMMTLILTGCGGQSVNEVSNDNVRFAGLKGKVSIVVDNETGCKYIREQNASSGINSYSVALTVLLKEDGTPDCGK